jgi:hypothetical protein
MNEAKAELQRRVRLLAWRYQRSEEDIYWYYFCVRNELILAQLPPFLRRPYAVVQFCWACVKNQLLKLAIRSAKVGLRWLARWLEEMQRPK